MNARHLGFVATAALALPTIAQAAPGDLVFTEVNVSPGVNSTCEWWEVANVSGSSFDLSSCRACVGPDTNGEWDCEDLSGSIPASNGLSDPFLMARDTTVCPPVVGTEECVGWKSFTPDTATPDENDGTVSGCIAADYLHGMTLVGSRSQTLCILCGSGDGNCEAPGALTLVDGVTFYWDDGLGDLCDAESYPGKCSVTACEPTAESNDLVTPGEGGDWIMPPAEDASVYYVANVADDGSATFFPALGSPGATNTCPDCNVQVCDIVISEVLAAPDNSTDVHEYIELYNASSSPRSLEGCSLYRYKRSEDENSDSGWSRASEDSYTLSGMGDHTMAPGEALVLGIDGCVFPQDDDTEYEAGAFCPTGEFVIDITEISNSGTTWIGLRCPIDAGGGTCADANEIVDEITITPDAITSESGISWMLDPAAGTPLCEANDSDANWCTASLKSQSIPELAGTNASGEAYCNYGTPGSLAECLTSASDPPSFRMPCRCGTTGSPRSWLPAVGLGLAALLVGRRRRR